MDSLSALTVSSHFLRYLLASAREFGVDLSPQLAHWGIDEARLRNPEERIPLSVEQALLEQVMTESGDDFFGLHMGELIRPIFMGSLGYASMSSATLGDAIDLMLAYYRVSTEQMVFSRHEIGEQHVIRWQSPLEHLPHYRQRVEAYFSAAICFGRWITATDQSPQAIHFAYEAPEDVREYQRIFRCPVRFNQPYCEIVLASESLRLPLSESDPDVHRLAAIKLKQEVDAYEVKGLFCSEVKLAIKVTMAAAPPTLENVAEALGIKPWTLQRRLKQHDLDFSSLVTQMRQELARQLLTESEASISHIAAELGFSEQSAFNHAFRRWFGCTPLQYRKKEKGCRDPRSSLTDA